MSDQISKVKELYAAFGRGDAGFILSNITDDCSWEFEAPAVLSWAGIRRGPKEAAGFFTGIAAEHADPALDVTEFLESGDVVASFGRYDATVKATGVRVSTPLAHYFKFRDGKVSRFVNYINSGAFVEAAQKA